MDIDFFTSWMQEITRVIAVSRDRLTRLDAAIGDADHGTNLDRGFTAVRQALQESPPDSPGELLVLAGNTLIRRVGGASGPLYGSAFRTMGKTLGEGPEVSMAALVEAFEAGLAAVTRLGGAKEGDKTMVDALAPAIRAMAAAVQAGMKPAEAVDRAVRAAEEGAKSTIPLQARKGRASYLGPRSAGHEDPGAASAVLIVGALRQW